MRFIAVLSIILLNPCLSFSQSVCDQAEFVGFKQFKLNQKLNLTLTQGTYDQSLYLRGFPRIESIKVEHADSAQLLAMIESGSSLKFKSSKKIKTVQNLADLLPEIAKSLSNTYPNKESQANCFNATLNWFQNTAHLEFTPATAFLSFLSENFSEVADGSDIQFGDVLLLYSEGHLLHSAVYIDSNIFWHKASSKPTDPWTFEDLQMQMQYYCKSTDGKLNFKFLRKAIN